MPQTSLTRAAHPDFLIIGAPKAGTTAMHAALARHPQIYVSNPKEPKYWLCDDAPPPAWRGPGDAHSQQEWIWRRHEYAGLFTDAPVNSVRGESTPFYLWSKGAHRRIGEQLPDVKLIALVRDPIDRAYSNWMHLWSDGLEPIGDFEEAFARQDERIIAGWAPFWRYAGLGRYGDQLEHLYRHVDPERVLVLRYRDMVESPRVTLDRACRFLGISEGNLPELPRDNSRNFVQPGLRPTLLGPVVRAGARLGAYAPPQVWRRASQPLMNQLSGREARRPRLTEEQRARLIPAFVDDVRLLESLTGQDFGRWLSTESQGSFAERRAASAGSAVARDQVGDQVGDQAVSARR